MLLECYLDAPEPHLEDLGDHGDLRTASAWLGEWLRAPHGEGRRRRHGVAALQEQLESLGISGSALIAGPWLADGRARGGVWREGPWPPSAAPPDQLHAEGAGELPRAWLRATVSTFLADPERAQPGLAPRIWYVGSEADQGLLIDPALAGVRPGLVLLHTAFDPRPFAAQILEQRALRQSVLAVCGLLRADRFRTHWERLADLLTAQGAAEPGLERPVNPQEVVLDVAEAAARLAQAAARAFEVASVAILAPDPDDEHVYCLGAHGARRHAYDAGVHPPLPSVGYGLSAAYAMGSAYDPAGGPVLVRAIVDREELTRRYRDLGFDDEALDEGNRPQEHGAHHRLGAPYLSESYLDPDLLEVARRGPWVFTAQRLPSSLSPSRRNLVIRFQGRSLSTAWSTPGELARTSRDRSRRLASASVRIHGELVRRLDEGLASWRAGLRQEVLRELTGARRWPALCSSLAAWLSARCVSLFEHDRGNLRLLAWSLPRPAPGLVFEAQEDLHATTELRLLQAPLHPRRELISAEGFLGWPPLVEALGTPPENTGTVPILVGGQPVGLLRVDGGMSLFGGLIRRRSPQGALHRHRPGALPAHLRPVLEEVAQLLGIALGRPSPTADSGWSRWVAQVLRGDIPREEALARLQRLRAEAPTRSAAAARVGVHRNTFHRHLERLARHLGDEARW